MSGVVIAGGGIAGLEALIALRSDLGPDVPIAVLESEVDLVERQRSVVEPFGGPAPPRFDVGRIVADHGGRLLPDRLRGVDVQAHRIRTVRGAEIAYEALLVAVGARPDMAVPGALTFTGPRDVGAYRRLLAAVETGRVRDVAFAVPRAIAWTLPLYELALQTAVHLQAAGHADVGLTVVTPERAPLEAFGAATAARVQALLSRRGIRTRTETTPLRVGPGGLEVDPGGLVRAEWIVALPRLGGPWIDGLPHDRDGFIPVDDRGAVPGAPGVWAAGDATSFPVKQGGLAARQADAAASAIAAALGAPVVPEPFVPVLRGLLLDPEGERILESAAPEEEPWWPAGKVDARHLGPYLAAERSVPS